MYYPKVTIVVLNFNGLSDTQACIKSLLKTRYPNFKVIIVDNGSEIDEARILEKTSKDNRLQFKRFPKNLGFSGGNNKILKGLKDKYIVLLNNDTEVTPKWLDPLIQTLENNPKIAVVQPKILWLTNKKYFDYAGACGGFIDMFGYPFTRGRIFNTKELDKGQYDSISDIFWASGAAMMIRTSIFKKVGYFDERFFNYMEEIDLCFRIHWAGFLVMCEPKSVIYHKGAASSSKNEMKKRFWEHRNSLLLLIKNYPLRTLVYVLPIRIILEYVSILHYVFCRRLDFVLSVIFSQISFFTLAPSMLIDRKKIKKLGNSKNAPLILKDSIVIKYFVFKKRKFSNLSMPKMLNKIPKRIVYLLYNTSNNGGNRVVFEHVNRLTDRGYNVSVFALFSKKPTWFSLKTSVRNILSLICLRNIDVIVATFWPTAFIAFLKNSKKKFYFIQNWEENFYQNKMLKFLVKFSLKLPLRKIVVSKFLESKILENNQKERSVFKIGDTGLDRSIFKFHSLKKNGSKIKILSVISSYSRYKGIDLLILAIGKLKKMHQSYEFTLASAESKVYSAIFDTFVSNPSRIELAKLYQESHILLGTSRTEGFFLPGIEAMACGCLLITTNNGGVLEYAENNKNSIVLEKIDKLWKEDIIEKVIRNKRLYNLLVSNGVRTVRRYSWNTIIRDLENIYELK